MMNDENDTSNSRVKNLLPWIGLGVLTVGLMIVFKFSEQGYSDLKVTGSNLLAKYTENLSPFFVNSELTNEDVFNFALYNNLPIDKDENRVLTIESDSYGNENYVITSLDSLPKTSNLELYKSKLSLTSVEQDKIDSILNNYKDDLYASVLVANNKSVALDPKISLLQKAIGTDIYKFALQKKENTKGSVAAKNYALENQDKIMSAFRDAKVQKPEQFIFMTPDTAFSHHFTINKKKLNEEIKNLEKVSKDTRTKSDWVKDIIPQKDYSALAFNKIPEDEYNYQIDSNYSKLTLPVTDYLDYNFVNYDSLKWGLDSLAGKLSNFHFALKGFEKGLKLMIETNDGVKADNFELEFNFENLGDFISKTVSAATASSSPEDWERFGAKMDSLSQALSTMENDSTAFLKIKQRTEQLKKSLKKNKQQKN